MVDRATTWCRYCGGLATAEMICASIECHLADIGIPGLGLPVITKFDLRNLEDLGDGSSWVIQAGDGSKEIRTSVHAHGNAIDVSFQP